MRNVSEARGVKLAKAERVCESFLVYHDVL